MSKSKKTKENSESIDHDQLFKQLLTTFFLEFLELFVPEFFAAIDPNRGFLYKPSKRGILEN
jgi:hypothetical protein